MEKIKIMHCADVHGDLDALEIYANQIKEKNPDIATVTGDLINEVFTEEESKEFFQYKEGEESQYQEKVKNILNTVQAEVDVIGSEKMVEIFPQELFKAIMTDTLEEGSILELPGEEQKGPSTKDLYELSKNPITPISIRNAVNQYLDAREKRGKKREEGGFIKIAETSMKTQYREIEKIIEDTECLVLPGNYDGRCLEEIMPERKIHKEIKTIKDIKIAGYGSAKEIPPWIPKELIEEFRGIVVIDKESEEDEPIYQGSEAGWFMIQEDPDIVLLHQIPQNDEGLQMYIMNDQPYILLTGHIHEAIRIGKLSENTHLIMPGKLGKAPAETPQLEELKTFVEIDINKEGRGDDKILTLEKVMYYQIKDGKIIPFREYKFDDNGNFKRKENLSNEAMMFIGPL